MSFWICCSFITIVVSVLFFIWKKKKWIRMYKSLGNIPSNWPVIGNAYLWVNDDAVRMEALQRFARISIKQGGLTSLWLGPRYFIVVTDARAAEIALKTCLDKDDIINIVHEFLGNGSIFAPVEIWRPRRKVIAPTFSSKNLNQFAEVFYQQSSIMVKNLRKMAGKGTFSVWKYLTTYTMDSVCESTLGVKVDAQSNPDQPFLEAFDKHCQMASHRVLHPPIAQKAYTYFPIYKEYVKPIHFMWEFVDSIVRKKRKELLERDEIQRKNNNGFKEQLSSRKTFLELFMESSGGASGFTDLELREETLVVVLAGTDTSAVGSAYTCLMLARHPEVQEKIYEEIKEMIGDSDQPITAADLPKLKYLEAVVKESLRLYPPVPIIVRKVYKDFQLPSGLTIVKGTSLMVSIWGIHRNPVYWGEDVDVFRPERFIESGPSHPAAFVPFSNGPRSCLGYQYAMMSMKTALANVIRNYRLLPATPVQDKNAPLRVKFDIMMKHVDNYELQIEART